MRTRPTYSALAATHGSSLGARPDFRFLALWAEQARVQPGSSLRLSASPTADVGIWRVFLSAVPGEPEVSYFLKKRRAGGSRRRGRLASNEWGAVRYRHFTCPWPDRLSVDDIVVAGAHYLLHAIPRWSLGEFPGIPVPIAVHPGDSVSVLVSNYDVRPAYVSGALLVQLVKKESK